MSKALANLRDLSGAVAFTFNEPVDKNTFNASGVTFSQSKEAGYGGNYTLTNYTYVFTTDAETVLWVNLSIHDWTTINSIMNLASTAEETFLTMGSRTIADTAGAYISFLAPWPESACSSLTPFGGPLDTQATTSRGPWTERPCCPTSMSATRRGPSCSTTRSTWKAVGSGIFADLLCLDGAPLGEWPRLAGSVASSLTSSTFS